MDTYSILLKILLKDTKIQVKNVIKSRAPGTTGPPNVSTQGTQQLSLNTVDINGLQPVAL